MANLQIVISALNKASGDITKVKDDIAGVGKSGKEAQGGVDGFFKKIQGGIATAALAAGAVTAVSVALKQVYQAAKEGAELEYATTKFDNLAASIDTVSTALMDDLREATAGMVSDAELIGGAGDFMALGLAKSHDEVVRLATVAGALNMNMNQLVLTLTNQTTMRFDALGVSVDGFDAKVKALEATGLSASDAFKEAFLQQAEEQIGKVGSAADQSVGSFKRLESATKNLADSLKKELAPIIAPVAEGLANLITGLTPTDLSRFPEFLDTLTVAMNEGAIVGTQYDQMLRDVHNGFVSIPDGIRQVNELLSVHRKNAMLSSDANQDLLMSLFDSTSSWDEFKQAAEAANLDLVMLNEEIYNSAKAEEALADETAAAAVETQIAAGDFEGLASALGITTDQAKEMITAWEDSAEAHAMMLAELDNITSLEGNYQGIISLAYKFTDILEDITEQETIMANNPIGSEKYEEAKAKAEELKGTMAELANRVTLDMFQATIATGGVTEAELSAYMQMAIDMGMMSEEGAKAAMDAYGNAIKTINGYEIDEKTGNITFDAQQAFEVITMINAMEIADKNGNIDIFVKYHGATPDFYDPYENYTGPGTAVGGAVNAGNPYTWQEYGYRGEVFVPSADGFVLSRADAERALARALYGGESAVDPEAIGKAVAGALSRITSNKTGGNVYNLTMPTSNNPADVRTAFELMEAWA